MIQSWNDTEFNLINTAFNINLSRSLIGNVNIRSMLWISSIDEPVNESVTIDNLCSWHGKE